MGTHRISYGKWAPWEDAMLLDMRTAGVTYTRIAKKIGRSTASVKQQWYSRLRHSVTRGARAFPQHVVPVTKLPEWYALGWHITELSGVYCTLEWRSERSPNMPEGA